MFLSKYNIYLFTFPHLFLYLFFFEFPLGDAAYEKHCSTTICHGVSISYPFWVDKGADMYCGYPGFGLNCSEGNDPYPILELPEDTYYVTHINYEENSLTLVDIDVFEVTCPRARHNLTLGNLPLSYNESFDMNISFYFNCTNSGIGILNQVSCLGSEEDKYSYVFIEGEDPGWSHIGNCEEKVVAAVKKTEFVSVPNLVDTFDEAMNSGFVLDWSTAVECGPCEHTHGRCGYNDKTQQLVCFCDDKSIKINGRYCPVSGNKNGLQKPLIAVVIVGTGLVLSIMVFFLIRKKQLFSKGYLRHQDIEDFIRQYGSLAPKRYKYSEVKRMTNSFKNKLGQGGYGIVYKGILQNGTSVAVKILNTSKENGEDFINEVASISRTSHVNIVTLIGFCFEGKRRALIYEFMANGSLDKFIHNGTNTTLTHTQLGWEKLFQITVGIARGLEYLHRGCNTRILHFDIKPHNILLDEEFLPKISDFGLAKLCLKKESIVSMMIARGTIGYIAPEVFNRNFGGVSPKSDVYSYGMLVLEMIGVRKKTNVDDDSSELYFPDWIYKRVELSQDLELYGNVTSEESEILRKMTIIGLWCIQMKPSERPSMSKVIEMLEGSVEVLQIPPKPFFASPPRVIEGSSSTSAFLIEE